MNHADIVVAGHICLDVIPEIGLRKEGLHELFVPGKLVDVGPAMLSTGGAVSNTGLALHRLGFSTRLMGKIGDDLFGQSILNILKSYDEQLAQGMIVSPGEASSYTVVINPPQVDRIFLHCTGANDTFTANDLILETIQAAKLFHFGYPPLMKQMYSGGGNALKEVFTRVKAMGVTTSLDLAKPDPDSFAGKADWTTILAATLPYVDIFLPSIEEILYMLDRDLYDEMEQSYGSEGLISNIDGALLSRLSDELIQMGAAVVAIKLGEYGLYVRTTANKQRIQAMGVAAPVQLDDWLNQELLVPCFQVEVRGTTGAGDCTIAGFLAGMLSGLSLKETMIHSVAVGAFNVEASDAVSGIPAWSEVNSRLAGDWKQISRQLSLPGWTWNENHNLCKGPGYQ